MNPAKREILSLALHETTHALRFAEAAARRFTVDIDELETGSKMAISVTYIENRLTDAQASLVAAAEEIGALSTKLILNSRDLASGFHFWLLLGS